MSNAVLLMPFGLGGCNADWRSALTEAQFDVIVRTCSLPASVNFEQRGEELPIILIPQAGVSDNQVDCFRSEQDRIGASADMAR